MADFEYRVNGGPWVLVEGVTIPYALSGILNTDVVDARFLGDIETALGFDGERIVEISQMSGGRTALTPPDYWQRVVKDAFNPAFHAVGDPLSPSCVIYTHKAVKSGRWSDPTVWDTGTLPNANAVVCSGPYDLTYDVFSNVLIKDIHINGQGSFTVDPLVQTRLWVDTFLCDGKLIIGGSEVECIPESGIVTGGVMEPQFEMIFWQSEAPLATARLGLNTMGPVRIHGAHKEEHLQIDGNALAGSTKIKVRQNPIQAGWKVGHQIMIVGTEYSGISNTDPQYSGPTQLHRPSMLGPSGTGFTAAATDTQLAKFKNNQTEVRVITGISGLFVELDTPLNHDHITVTDTLPRGQVVTLYPVVGMLSQSIRFRTADASDTVWQGDLSDLQKRAHSMFMFSDDIQARDAEFKNMGRSASDPSLNGPDNVTRYATAGTGSPITNVNNAHGRYPLHIHRTGAFFSRKQVAVERCSVWAPTNEYPIPGWGIVHHDSRAAIDGCNVYNFRGAGIVSELGNEIGQWVGNICAWGRGDGFAIETGYRLEIWHNHNGHSGVGFESQARQILQQDNYVSGCQQGWLFLQQNVGMLARIPDGDSLRYRDPLTLGGANLHDDYGRDTDTYGIEATVIPDFTRNHCWDTNVAFWKAHQQFTDRADPIPLVLSESHWVNCATSYVLLNYTFHYYVYDSLWIGVTNTGSIGARLGTVAWANNFNNMKLRRFNIGFHDEGYGIAYQGYFHEIDFEDVTTHFNGAHEDTYSGDPTLELAWGVMGNEVVTGPNTGIARVWAVTRDEDLPVPYPLAPFGPDSAERAAHPCPALGEDPYVVLLGASDTTLTPTGREQYLFRALIVDSFGYRWHGDHQSPSTAQNNMTPRQTRPNSIPANATGTDIARRNGVFNDAGTWKTRAWFIDVDRSYGHHFTWYIDFTLTGFDAEFLAENTVDPVSTNPMLELPLVPEEARTTPIAAVAAPIAVSVPAATVYENVPLALELKASTGLVRWAVTGGADMAQFETGFAGGRWVLRWAGDGTKDFEDPLDAGANNTYNVEVAATDFLGQSSPPLPIEVSVLDLNETIIDPFYDDFNRAAQPLEASADWQRVSGSAGAMINVEGTDNRVRGGNSGLGSTAVYIAPSTGSTRHFVESVIRKWNWNVNLVINFFDPDNYIRMRYELTGGFWRVQRVLAGVVTDMGNPAVGGVSGDLVRLEWNPATEQLTMFRNGVAQAPITIPGMPAGTRGGFFRNADANDGSSWATFRSGSF
jgi:hypothetical protein